LINLLGFCHSTYYYQHKLKNKDEQLREKITKVLSLNPAYGHRRVALALKVNRKRARRVMRKFGIKPYKRKARWRKRHDLDKKPAPFKNLIKGNWPIRPDMVYVSDFTYLRFQGKHLYLATFMDLFTREIVGWSLSGRHTKELVLDAFLDAIRNKGFQIPKIVHSDQGSEYTCQPYVKFLTHLGVKISMSKKQSPWENAYQESFYNNFKTDLGFEFDRFFTLGELIEAVHQTINYYNKARIHTSLKMPPEKYKRLYDQGMLKFS
jgi:putative transposase